MDVKFNYTQLPKKINNLFTTVFDIFSFYTQLFNIVFYTFSQLINKKILFIFLIPTIYCIDFFFQFIYNVFRQ